MSFGRENEPWSCGVSPEREIEAGSRELGLVAGLITDHVAVLVAREAEAVEGCWIFVVCLILHDGLLWDTEPVVRGHHCAVGEVERIYHFSRHRHWYRV